MNSVLPNRKKYQSKNIKEKFIGHEHVIRPSDLDMLQKGKYIDKKKKDTSLNFLGLHKKKVSGNYCNIQDGVRYLVSPRHVPRTCNGWDGWRGSGEGVTKGRW